MYAGGEAGGEVVAGERPEWRRPEGRRPEWRQVATAGVATARVATAEVATAEGWIGEDAQREALAVGNLVLWCSCELRGTWVDVIPFLTCVSSVDVTAPRLSSSSSCGACRCPVGSHRQNKQNDGNRVGGRGAPFRW